MRAAAPRQALVALPGGLRKTNSCAIGYIIDWFKQAVWEIPVWF
jgi:hypothetical protein